MQFAAGGIVRIRFEPDLRLPDLAARVHRADEPGRGLEEQRSRIKGKAFEMAFGQGAEDGPDHHGRLGIGDLAPVVGKGVPASHPEIAHGDDAVRRDGELGEETGNDRVPFGRPPGEQEQVAVVGVDDLAQVGEDLAERVADGPIDGPGIDAQGHIHEAERLSGLTFHGFVDVLDERGGRLFRQAFRFGRRVIGFLRGVLGPEERGHSLAKQLEAFGSGIEITLLAAIPAGSGLGTSSILASTVLGAINDFCGLAWDKNDICSYTLVLEQLLTTGGGWQDQYGGVFSGIKLLQSEAGFGQNPLVRWLPDQLFIHPDYRDCHLLYYTGITRTAKSILAEIVSSMFLNSGPHLSLLAEMKAHAMDMSEAILRSNFDSFGRLVGKTWIQNQALDCGTNPPAVAAIIEKIKDYTLGYKLPGAGGGGYLYMVAKGPQAAGQIRRILTEQAPNPRARFVEMTLSDKGLQVSRS